MIPQIPSDKLQSEGQLPSPVEKRNSNKMIARIAGVLFFTATVASILVSVGFLNPASHNSDYLLKVFANENRVIIGALFLLIAAFASAGIAISLYPILRKYHEGLALARLVSEL